MRRLVSSLALALALAPAVAAAQPEGSSNLAQEGFGGEAPRTVQCTATSSDEECLEHWERHINWWSFDYKPGAEQLPEHRHMPAPFGFALINFLVFAGVLYRLAGRPLADYVKGRHITIKRDLDEAARLRRAAEAKLADYESKIAGMDAEIDALVAGIREEAQQEKARIVASAEAEAVRLRRDAESQIANELERVRRELRREVVDAAIAAATALVAEKAGADDQRKLVDRYLAGLDALPAQASGSGRAS